MVFNPQYGFWAYDDFSSSDDVTYANPLTFIVKDGATTLVPSGYIGSVKVYNGVWDPVTTWTINNNIDSLSGLSGNFSTVVSTGFNSSITGLIGYSGLSGQSCVFTSTASPVTGANGYASGSTACFVYNAENQTSNQFINFVLEFSARTIRDTISHSLTNDSMSSGTACHGITIVDGGPSYESSTFIEVHPDGLKVHGISGAILAGDFSSYARRIRVTRLSGALSIMTDNGDSLYVPTGLTSIAGGVPSQYITFGAHPVLTGDIFFTGSIETGFSQLSWLISQSGVTGLAGFAGTTLWDDVSIRFGNTTTSNPSGVIYSWPTGVNTLYTAPWYPSKAVDKYIGATVDSIQIGAGWTKVSAQYLVQTGNLTNQTTWTGHNTQLTLTNQSSIYSYLDLSNIPIYNGFDNAIRFKIEASGNGLTNTPQIDAITVAANTAYDFVDVNPSWKLSSLPKNVFFIMDKNKYAEYIPPAHYQDDIYLHNEKNISIYNIGEFIVNESPNLASGEVVTISNGSGIVKVKDGKYGPAFRNIYQGSGIKKSELSPGYYEISTGIFKGDLNDSFEIYPTVASLPTTATGTASCIFKSETFVGTDGDFITAQTVNLASWVDASSSSIIGIKLSGSSGVAQNGLINVYEGIISIPRGPGAFAVITNGLEEYAYFLDGHNYRTPKEFRCAATITGSSQNSKLILGFGARRTALNQLDSERWGQWVDDLEYHNSSEFTLYSLSGYTAVHSYMQFASTSNANRVSYLDDKDVYDTITYRPVRRGSMLFEGWVRPFGLTGSAFSGVLFQSLNSSNKGFQLYLNRSGEVTALVDIVTTSPSVGKRLEVVYNLFQTNNGVTHTGTASTISIPGTNSPLVFGDWNHIGLYQESRCLGDTYTATNQPDVADGNSNHGVRTSKLYLEVNGAIVNSVDTALDAYSETIYPANSVASGQSYPATDQYSKCWPRATSFAVTGSRTGILGKDVICDFDHIRFGIHNAVDARMWSNVNGAKITPPMFTPWNAIKIPQPTSGGYDHMRYAHIYRFDYPTTYQGWDEGFAINHALLPSYTLAAELTGRGINTSKFFVKPVEDGPKGRPALRLGPGANVVIPWNSLDERLFNGTGSLSLAFPTTVSKSGLYYANNANYLHNLSSWYTGVSSYSETTANSRVIFGGKFRLHNYPTGEYYGDLMAYDEATYSSYPYAGIYIAVDNSGLLTFGTRRNIVGNIHDGYTNAYALGPFTGINLPLETWTHVAIDAKLSFDNPQSGAGYLKLYVGTELVSEQNVTLLTGGGLDPYTGRGIGYQGLLGGETGLATMRSNFIIGGETPKDSQIRTYQYMDMDVSECYVVLPLNNSTFDYSYFAATGDTEIPGLYDYSIKNSSTKIAPVIGTGQGLDAFYYGKTLYPNTSFSDAGEHYFWATSTAGNDPENIRDFGYKVNDTNAFNNAESYYVVYEDAEATKAFGTTDSPIQIVNTVPPEGVNLALITNRQWNSDNSISTFNLSDQNYSNVTNLNGDSTVASLSKLGSSQSGLVASGSIAAEDIRLGSFPVWNENSSNSFVGYFVHLIGGDNKGIYAPSAYGHSDVINNEERYYFNTAKIKGLISITDADGNPIPFDEFPYDIVTSPYSPKVAAYKVTDPEYVDHSYLGFGTINTGASNEDGVFTCMLVAAYQSINKTVFINYPSKLYEGTVINLQDSEVYNPVPFMKKVAYSDGPKQDGSANIVGSFSLNYTNNQKSFDLTIWGADLTGWVQ